MYEDTSRLEAEIRELELLMLTTQDPSVLARISERIREVEKEIVKIEGHIEEDREFVEEQRDRLTAEQREFYNKLYDNPVVKQLIESNTNSIETTALKLGYTIEETEVLIKEYVQETTDLREDHAIVSYAIIEKSVELGMDRESVEKIAIAETQHAEECYNEYVKEIEAAFAGATPSAENREAFKEQIDYSIQTLDNDLYRLDYTMSKLNDFKLSEEYKILQDQGIHGQDAYRKAFQAFVEKDFNSLSAEEKEKFEFFHSDYLYDYYLYDHIEGKGVSLENLLEGDNLEQLQQQMEKSKEAKHKMKGQLENLEYEEVIARKSPEQGVEIPDDIKSGLKDVKHDKEGAEQSSSKTYVYSEEKVNEILEERNSTVKTA